MLFETFDAEIVAPARRAAAAAAHAARLARTLYRAGEQADLHLLRARAGDAGARAREAADLVGQLQAAIAAFSFGGASDAGLPAAVGQGVDAGYGAAFERACAALAVPLEGAYPDYRIFPLTVRIRLAEERVVVGRRSWWVLRPEALARLCKRERDRLMGGAFAADRFGAALVRAYELLLPEAPAGIRHVRLTRILEVLQLAGFGRNTYTRDEFAFDLYRLRNASMDVVTRGSDRRRLVLLDVRGRDGGTPIEVPTARGTKEAFTALRVERIEPAGAALPERAEPGAASEGDGRGR